MNLWRHSLEYGKPVLLHSKVIYICNFRVVLLELLTRQKPVDIYNDGYWHCVYISSAHQKQSIGKTIMLNFKIRLIVSGDSKVGNCRKELVCRSSTLLLRTLTVDINSCHRSMEMKNRY